MKQKIVIILSIITLLVILVGIFVWYTSIREKKAIGNYDECIAAGYPVMESYPEQCAVPGGKTFTRTVQEMPISLEGRTVCLPHKDMDGPHTLECALGLKTDDGRYYALGTDPYEMELSNGDRRVRVTGTLKHEEDTQYNSEGTVTVTAHEFLD